MLLNSQFTKQYIVLRADPEALSDQIDLRSDVETIDDGSTRGRRKQAGQDRHCGRFASAIVTQKWRDLALVEVEIQPIYG